MKKILIAKKTSMIATFILSAPLSYLLYNYTLLGVALASIYILATGILNCKYKNFIFSQKISIEKSRL